MRRSQLSATQLITFRLFLLFLVSAVATRRDRDVPLTREPHAASYPSRSKHQAQREGHGHDQYGQTFKRCGCRNEQGKRLEQECPQLPDGALAEAPGQRLPEP